jgi:hypothetical protein
LGRVLTGVVLLAGVVACGDDDNSKPDASADGAVEAGGGGAGGNFIPRRDASVAPTDPIRDCDRFDPTVACPAGTTCELIARVFAGTDGLSLYSGCVEKGRNRGLGDPCDPNPSSWSTYQTEGLTDLVLREPCGAGLICGPDPKIRGATTCQPSCATGRFGDSPKMCSDKSQFCVGGDLFQEFCRPSDGCDVTTQTGCPMGTNCYLRPTDDGTGFMSLCFPPDDMLVADGKACEAYNQCRPGSSCNGPLNKAPASWAQADYKCRPSCNANGNTVGGGNDGDGGADDDGGTAAPAGCGTGLKCSSFAASGLDLSPIPMPPYGQCE